MAYCSACGVKIKAVQHVCLPSSGEAVSSHWKRMWTLTELKPGDTVRHVSGGGSLIVIATDGASAVAVRAANVTNPYEWEVLREPVASE